MKDIYEKLSERQKLLKMCLADAEKDDWNGLHWDLMERVVPILEAKLAQRDKEREALEEVVLACRASQHHDCLGGAKAIVPCFICKALARLDSIRARREGKS